MTKAWPELPVEAWRPARDTLTLWLQVIGKVRIARTPLLDHWWNAPLYVTAHGLTTSLMPAEAGRSFSIDLDFRQHRLDVTTTTGQSPSMALEPKSVKDFHAELVTLLEAMDLATEIWPVPVELPDAIAFTDDDTHSSYDPAAVTAFWRSLVEIERVFDVFGAVPRQGESGQLLSGRPRPGDDPIFGQDRPTTPGRRAQLRPARDSRGLLARGQQLRLLARGRGRGNLLRLPRTGPIPHHVPRPGQCQVRR